MIYRIFRLLLLALFFAILIVPTVGAKERTHEQDKVPATETDEVTPVEITPLQPVELITTETTQNPRAGEEINWQVISSGGNIGGTSASYTLSGTAGQTATGSGSSASYGLSHGFWQVFGGGSGGCCDTPGDANNDGGCNLGDAGYIINYIFYDGPEPVCMEEGDANADGGVNLGDAGFIINYIFYDGPTPTCGP